jgi:hypothetical protein
MNTDHSNVAMYTLEFINEYSQDIITDSDAPDKNNPRFYPQCKNACTVLKESFLNNPSVSQVHTVIVFNKTRYTIQLRRV